MDDPPERDAAALPGMPAGAEHHLVLSLAATLDALTATQERLSAFLRRAGLAPRIVGRAELLLEELVTNVINHGGLAAPAAADLRLEAVAEPGGACRLTFEDPGQPFDAAAATPPGLPARLEDARPGGLGLVLLQRMASDLAYERLPTGRNRLTFRLAGAA